MLAKAWKCELLEASIAVLWYIMSEEGIAKDPKKVEKTCTKRWRKDKKYIGLGNF